MSILKYCSVSTTSDYCLLISNRRLRISPGPNKLALSGLISIARCGRSCKYRPSIPYITFLVLGFHRSFMFPQFYTQHHLFLHSEREYSFQDNILLTVHCKGDLNVCIRMSTTIRGIGDPLVLCDVISDKWSDLWAASTSDVDMQFE